MFIKWYSVVFMLVSILSTLRASITDPLETKRKVYFLYTCMQIPIFVCLLYS